MIPPSVLPFRTPEADRGYLRKGMIPQRGSTLIVPPKIDLQSGCDVTKTLLARFGSSDSILGHIDHMDIENGFASLLGSVIQS